MKRTINISIVNATGYDVTKKMAPVVEWFKPLCDIKFTVHPYFTPTGLLKSILYDEKQTPYRAVDPKVYDQIVAPFGKGYDIVLYIENLTQWGTTTGARGWKTGKTRDGAVMLQVGVDQNETIYYHQFGRQDAFFQFVRHEIVHALYTITGQVDKTHYWWDQGQFENTLKEIVFPERDIIITGDIWGFINRFFAIMKSSKIEKWAKAIEKHEGFFPGSRSFRNNNPGNLKYTGYTKSLGAIAMDDKKFSVFASYNAGFDALKQFLIDAKEGKLISYKPDMTLLQFFSVYAPSSDDNDPNRYAEVVAKAIGVPVDTKIKNL